MPGEPELAFNGVHGGGVELEPRTTSSGVKRTRSWLW